MIGAGGRALVMFAHGPPAAPEAGNLSSVPLFFVPGADDSDAAERLWQRTRSFAEEQTGLEVSDRRVFRVDYRHNEQDFGAEVGQPDPRTGEVCVAILESASFLLCTENRGVARGHPILIGVPERVVDFDPPAA